MDKFPQELIDLIIEQLADDPRALGTCLSLSRTFRPHAQALLFRTTRISSDLAFLKFTDVCHSSPAVQYLVRSLHFVYSIDLLARSGSVAARQLRILFLPNVDTLHIDGGGNFWDDSLVGSMTSVITSLTLEGVEFSSADSFRRCIRSFPQLKSLNLTGVSSPPSPRGSVVDGSFLWRANDMNIPLYALRSLRLHIPLRDVSEIQSILNGVRHTLSQLSVSPMLPNDKTPKLFTNAQVLDFSRIPVVDYVMSYIRHEATFLLEGLEFLELCVKKGTGPASLQHLTVIVPPLPNQKELEQLSGNDIWALLDTALSASRFASLKVLRVSIGSEGENMVVRRNIVERMPVLHEEGRLLIEAH
ncbi:uncharacterized protein BT62DRAFT_935209 [Guyanagaster necrorhizus]|uniref:F-box domain-containing protein n=1 Tax=Guyanagaster necrorhizus TaxID=856835 RepID=A0A9P8APR1_9AGAR|nr:uncharacterized protein BT62DRAFT_935209 [Guyanagaster necrorhizus MCA 3950]KAG7443254.1 hypothetical protein BT62DRAFT_935209 [Guyanagaster necrorhizus MCA 3950]